MRRAVGAVAVLFGVALVSSTLVFGIALARSGDSLIDGARPTMRDGVAQLRHDFDTLEAGGRQSADEAFPAIAQRLGFTMAEFIPFLEREYPHTAALLERREEISGALEATVTNLENHSDDFEAADDLPIAGVSLSSIPIVLIVLGVVLAVAGVLVLRRRDNAPVWVVAAIGALLVVPTLALQIPQKSADAEDLVDSLNLTDAVAIRTREQFEVQRAAVDEQVERLFPDVAAAFGLTTDQFLAALSEQFPDVGRSLDEVGPILGRIEREVRFREGNVDEFADVRDVPIVLLPGLLVIAGLVLVGLAAGELTASARRLRQGDTSAAPDVAEAPSPGGAIP